MYSNCSWWSVIVVLLVGVLGLGVLMDADTVTDSSPTPVVSPQEMRDRIMADYPRVDGSTSTLPMAQYIACYLYEVFCDWSAFEFEPRWVEVSASTDPAIAEFINGMSHSQTHESYVNLIENRADLILVARLPSEEEQALAAAAGVELDLRPVALDALVFVKNVGNPIKNITLEQIRAVYTGQITQWDELDPTSTMGVINAYRRDAQSGSQELIESMVMGDQTMIELPDMMIPTMGGLISMISDDPQGLGYSVYYYAHAIYPDQYIGLLAVEGIEPNSLTIGDGTYPLIAEVYVGVRADMPADSTAVLLRDWLYTPGGQSAITVSGYVQLLTPQP